MCLSQKKHVHIRAKQCLHFQEFTCSVITCGLLPLHWRSSSGDSIIAPKFSRIELLWREYLVLYSWGGLYHLDSLGLWDLISCLWEKFICIWLVLPPNSKDPSPRVHFRDVKQVYSQASRDQPFELEHMEKLTHDSTSLGEAREPPQPFLLLVLQTAQVPSTIQWSTAPSVGWNDENEASRGGWLLNLD